MKKTLITILATVLVCCCVVGGTLAWLMDETDPVVNTFTVGNVDIELEETTGSEYKMVPGNTIAKDPKVTVKAGSEACYVYVKIDETDPSDVINWAIASGWTALNGVAGVYYREQAELTADNSVDATYSVFANDQVTVADTLLNGDQNEPTITITAYAIQSANTGDAAAAWAEVNS